MLHRHNSTAGIVYAYARTDVLQPLRFNDKNKRTHRLSQFSAGLIICEKIQAEALTKSKLIKA